MYPDFAQISDFGLMEIVDMDIWFVCDFSTQFWIFQFSIIFGNVQPYMDRTIHIFRYVEPNMNRTVHMFWRVGLYMDRTIHTL